MTSGLRSRDPSFRLLLKAVNRSVGRFVPARLLARRYPGIPGRVHADDAMLRSESPEDIAHYASDARSAIDNVAASLGAAGRCWADVAAFLDLPSGYGRVTRFLLQHLDPTRVTACDVDRQAVRFCAAEFGVEGVVAQHEPAMTRFPRRYDIGFVGSLLTHLSASAGADFLRTIVATLTRDALLIFSTQGASCLDHLGWYGRPFEELEGTYRSTVARSGCCFVPYPGASDYGVTIHTHAYVEALIPELFGERLTLIRFAERGWDTHQDVWTYRLTS